MVPFSFENIARPAGLDAPSVYPVSDAARATHESFESYLQRAAPSASDPSQTEPPRNEPTRQDTRETQRDETDGRQRAAAETTTVTEAAAERNEEDEQRDAASEDEVVVAAEEPRATSQEVVIAVAAEEPGAKSQEVGGDSDDHADGALIAELANAPLGDVESQPNTSLAANAEASVDDGIPTGRKGSRASSRPTESADAETRTRRMNALDTTDEVVVGTNGEVAAGAVHEAEQVAKTTSQDDEPSRASRTQRRGNRSDLSANQPTRETTADATKPITVDVAETTVDTAGEDGSRQRQSRRDTDGPQRIGNATAGEATTTTSGTPSRFAQHLLARTDDPNARGPSITTADQARFVDRVARAVQATGERGGTLRLRLSPPELGALTLEVKVQGGVVSARVEADTPAARSLLLENLPLLRERLAEHGMRVDQFDVDLSDRHAGGTPDGLQQHDQRHEDRPRAKAVSQEPDDTSLASSSEAPTKNGNEQLNIIV